MSKKKPAAKSKPKPKARKSAKPAAKRAAKAATKRTPRPRAQTLPGMEQVRHTKLRSGEEKLSIKLSKEKATLETEGSGQAAGEIGEALTKDDADAAAAADLEG